MKTQVNLGTILEILLIPLLRRAKEFEKTESIRFSPKSVEIVKALNHNFSRLFRAKNYLITNYFRNIRIDDWVGNLLNKFLKKTFL